jgi:cell division septation protein DedD
MANNDDKPWLEEVPAEVEDKGFVDQYRPQVIGAGIVVLVAFLGLIVYVYQGGDEDIAPEPPVIAAPDGPVREKPEDPGGIEIPDRDKLVYNRVSGEEGEEAVNLEPGPELPGDIPEAAPEAAPEEPVEAGAPESVEEAVEEAPKAAVTETQSSPEPAPAPAAAPSAPSGDFMIQLGAFGSRESAARAWTTLQGKYPSVLGNLAPDYEALKRSSGTLYRLRAGGFADRAGAEAACAKLKAQGQGCFPAER